MSSPHRSSDDIRVPILNLLRPRRIPIRRADDLRARTCHDPHRGRNFHEVDER